MPSMELSPDTRLSQIKRFALGDGSTPRSRIDAPLGQILFFTALCAWVAIGILHLTKFGKLITEVVSYDAIRWSYLTVLAIRELVYGRRDWRSLAGFAVTALLASIAWTAHLEYVFDGIFFIFAARDIPTKRIVRFMFVEFIVLIAFVITSAFLGIIENTFYTSETRGVRYCLGFSNPNRGPGYLFLASCFWAYLRGDRFKVVDALAIVGAMAFLFWFTDSRTSMLATCTLAIVMLAYNAMPASWHSSRILKVVLVGSVVFAAVVSVALCLAYDPSVPWMAWLDDLLSWRLHLAHDMAADYGIPLLGQDIPYGSVKNWQYVVDNLYVNLLVHYGVVFFGIAIVASTATMNRLHQQGQLRLLAIIAVMAFYSIAEVHCYHAYLNAFLFFLGILMTPPSEGDKEFEKPV